MIKLTDYVIKFFEKKGVKTAFSITGGGCMHLTDSLRKSELIQTYFMHHEQSLLMASEGYTRLTNNLALNVVTTGPGGTNTLTGVLGMWMDSIPGIIISGQVISSHLSEGTGCRQIGDQEFDIIKLVKPITKYAHMIRDKNEIYDVLNTAYNEAISGRPGPVWIDIPLDIQGSSIEENFPMTDIIKEKPDVESLDKFYEILNNSKKPIFVLGGGIRLSNSYNIFNRLINDLKIPVVTGSHSGIDSVDNTYDYYAGRIGILGQLTSNQIIQDSDLVIGLGTRCPVKMTGYNHNSFAPNAKKIFIDIDENEINKHKFNIDLKIICDIKEFLHQIDVNKINLNIDNWRKFVIKKRKEQTYYYDKHKNLKEYVSMYYFIYKAKEYFNDLPIITSNGTAHVVTQQMYRLNKNQRVFTNVGCASMGFGLPAAIGACIANEKNPVICIEGDGSLMMNLQELQTLVEHNLPVKMFLINNNGYLSMKMTQNLFFKGQQFGCDKDSGISFPNYKKIAKTFGIKYFSIKNNKYIKQTLNKVMNEDGPLIIELFCHPYEKHEPKVEAKGYDIHGKIIPGDLTDMHISDNFEYNGQKTL